MVWHVCSTVTRLTFRLIKWWLHVFSDLKIKKCLVRSWTVHLVHLSSSAINQPSKEDCHVAHPGLPLRHIVWIPAVYSTSMRELVQKLSSFHDLYHLKLEKQWRPHHHHHHQSWIEPHKPLSTHTQCLLQPWFASLANQTTSIPEWKCCLPRPLTLPFTPLLLQLCKVPWLSWEWNCPLPGLVGPILYSFKTLNPQRLLRWSL